jgi:hypothetical protein
MNLRVGDLCVAFCVDPVDGIALAARAECRPSGSGNASWTRSARGRSYEPVRLG